MPDDPSIHRRRSIRLPGYDYTQPGAYSVTIDTHRHRNLFGKITNGEMRLNEWGIIAHAEWLKTAVVRPEITLDEFKIMPNHMHGIIMIMDVDFVGARRRRAPTTAEQFGRPVSGSIPTIIRAYKSAVTYCINRTRRTTGAPLWQRNYYEHVIRNEHDLSRIREYIRNNPMRWELDMGNGGDPTGM